jgi:hypothetical protein
MSPAPRRRRGRAEKAAEDAKIAAEKAAEKAEEAVWGHEARERLHTEAVIASWRQRMAAVAVPVGPPDDDLLWRRQIRTGWDLGLSMKALVDWIEATPETLLTIGTPSTRVEQEVHAFAADPGLEQGAVVPTHAGGHRLEDHAPAAGG